MYLVGNRRGRKRRTSKNPEFRSSGACVSPLIEIAYTILLMWKLDFETGPSCRLTMKIKFLIVSQQSRALNHSRGALLDVYLWPAIYWALWWPTCCGSYAHPCETIFGSDQRPTDITSAWMLWVFVFSKHLELSKLQCSHYVQHQWIFLL